VIDESGYPRYRNLKIQNIIAARAIETGMVSIQA
jgi:hypothetical protein